LGKSITEGKSQGKVSPIHWASTQKKAVKTRHGQESVKGTCVSVCKERKRIQVSDDDAVQHFRVTAAFGNVAKVWKPAIVGETHVHAAVEHDVAATKGDDNATSADIFARPGSKENGHKAQYANQRDRKSWEPSGLYLHPPWPAPVARGS
jgi:hypothetical protein